MTVGEALKELDELLTKEERALITIDLDTVVGLTQRKTELVKLVEAEYTPDIGELTDPEIELARSVHSKAHRNRFLLQHLRGCLTTVDPVSNAGQTYGRDGVTKAVRPGGVVRVRL